MCKKKYKYEKHIKIKNAENIYSRDKRFRKGVLMVDLAVGILLLGISLYMLKNLIFSSVSLERKQEDIKLATRDLENSMKQELNEDIGSEIARIEDLGEYFDENGKTTSTEYGGSGIKITTKYSYIDRDFGFIKIEKQINAGGVKKKWITYVVR